MDFEFSSDALMLRDMLRRFIEEEARPLEMKYFSAGALEDQERARLHTVIEQMGLWGITVPEKFGGGGLDMVTACMLEEELGKTFLPMELGDVPPLMYACQGGQIERFLNPALAGKRRALLAVREPNAIRPEEWVTTATFQDGMYILNGKKLISSNPGQDDFLVVLAKAPEGVSAFLLECGLDGMQVSTNGCVTLKLDHCAAEEGLLLGDCGRALTLGVEVAPAACIRLGARHVGLAVRLLEMSTEYAKSWSALGALLKERPAVQRMLADVKVRIESTRWLVYHAAWMMDNHAGARSLTAEVRLASGEMLARVTNLSTMIFGGPGPSQEVDLHRYVQSAVPMESLEFGLDCARHVIAADLFNSPDKD
ncbi:MAG: acyl-CoA dehydrogenase [Chloroflexi bacterium]|nr:acyl-CoA dehydrogenase [Chloroflexota bacterium]